VRRQDIILIEKTGSRPARHVKRARA